MTCCSECFSNDAVRDLVKRLGDPADEPCERCGGEDGHVVDVSALTDVFTRIVDRECVPVDQLDQAPHINPFEEGEELSCMLDDRYGVFSDAACDKKEQLLYDILNAKSDPRDGDDRYPQDLWAWQTQNWSHWSHGDYWACFSMAAKDNGRAILKKTKDDNVEMAVDFLKAAANDVGHKMPAGTELWRARIGCGHRGKAIGALPAKYGAAGRANYKGEPALYVALTAETAAYEVRPSSGDHVTVAKFKTTRALRMCDLRRRWVPCTPFVETQAEFEKYLEIKSKNEARLEIGRELAVPVRRGDEDTAYLPTQVFTEMLRGLGYDGLMFSSSQHQGGDDVVIFDPDDAVVTDDVREMKINGVTYAMRDVPLRRNDDDE